MEAVLALAIAIPTASIIISVAVQHPSSSPTMKSSSPTTTHSSQSQPVFTQAHDFATQSFHSHVISVLQHVTLTTLHRLLSQRIRHYMQHSISHEQLSNNAISIEELLCRDNDEFPDLLTISTEDIRHCYTLTNRLGMKWASVLQRQGYSELAELTLSIVQRGNYLEPSIAAAVSPSTTDGDNDVDNNGSTNNCQPSNNATHDFVSPYTALHALRRYPNDCNASGLPLKYLPAVDTDDDTHDEPMQKQPSGGGDAAKSAVKSKPPSSSSSSSSSSARKVIQQIDTMVANGMTYWHYGWDAIEEAVLRNRKRIGYSKTGGHATTNSASATAISMTDADTTMNAMGNEEDDEVALPPAYEVDGEEGFIDNRNGGDGNCVGRNANEAVVDGSRVSKNSRKRGRSAEAWMANNNDGDDRVELEGEDHNGNDEDDNNQSNCKRGRPPSSIGTEVYHRDDILSELSLQERKQLIESTIHPPFPYETDMQCNMSADNEVMNGNDDGDTSFDEHTTLQPHHHAVICGALKDIGQIHLWEQTRNVSGTVLRDGNDATTQEEMTNPTQTTYGDRRGVLFGATEAQSLFQSQQQHQFQQRALGRAIKERLGRRVVSNAEHRAEYTQLATCSKVRWTEEGNDERTHHHLLEQSEASHKWIDMDLGECMIEVVDDKTELESVETKKNKVLLGFRSLEMALRM